jgi:hypothetical protein
MPESVKFVEKPDGRPAVDIAIDQMPNFSMSKPLGSVSHSVSFLYSCCRQTYHGSLNVNARNSAGVCTEVCE